MGNGRSTVVGLVEFVRQQLTGTRRREIVETGTFTRLAAEPRAFQGAPYSDVPGTRSYVEENVLPAQVRVLRSERQGRRPVNDAQGEYENRKKVSSNHFSPPKFCQRSQY